MKSNFCLKNVHRSSCFLPYSTFSWCVSMLSWHLEHSGDREKHQNHLRGWRTSAANFIWGNISNAFALGDVLYSHLLQIPPKYCMFQVNNKNFQLHMHSAVWGLWCVCRCEIVLLAASPEPLRGVFILLFKQLVPSSCVGSSLTQHGNNKQGLTQCDVLKLV